MNKKAIVVALVCFLAMGGSSYGQTSQNDSLQYQYIINTGITNFYKGIKSASWLFKGYYEMPIRPGVRGNAYFLDSVSFIQGTVNYEGNSYQNVPLLYDIYRDNLISLLPNQASKFVLIAEKVNSFDIAGHHFVRIAAYLNPGFYDQPYNGNISVLVKREKTIQSSTNAGKLEDYFDQSISFFIKRGGKYYNVSSEGNCLTILKDKKKELKQYIKMNNIKFKNDPVKALILIAGYYDRLTN